LVVIDDIACQRIQRCTLCHELAGLVDIDAWSNGAVVATVVLCQACKHQKDAVQTLLEDRYRPHRFGP
jgi:hypothetical protein